MGCISFCQIFYTDIPIGNENLLFLRYEDQLYSVFVFVFFLRKKNPEFCLLLLFVCFEKFDLTWSFFLKAFTNNPCRPIIVIDFLSTVCQKDDDDS